MKALVLRDDIEKTAAYTEILIKKGFQVICVETRKAALAVIRIDIIDLLVMDERVNGQLTHALILSAERRNPYVSAIMMTDRPGPDADELYDLIPSLYGLFGMDTSAELLGRLAMASIENLAEAEARVRRNALRYAEEDAIDDHWQQLEEEYVALDAVDDPEQGEEAQIGDIDADQAQVDVSAVDEVAMPAGDTPIDEMLVLSTTRHRMIRANAAMPPADQRVHASAQ